MNGCENTLMRTQEVLNPLKLFFIASSRRLYIPCRKRWRVSIRSNTRCSIFHLVLSSQNWCCYCLCWGPVLRKLNLIEFDNHFLKLDLLLNLLFMLQLFNQGYRPSNLINDAPIIFDDANLETYWRPENYSGEFYGLTSLREALFSQLISFPSNC